MLAILRKKFWVKAACLGAFALFFTPIPGCAPTFSELQSARVIAIGQTEITSTVSVVRQVNLEGEQQIAQSHTGIQLAYGYRHQIELRFRYERIITVYHEYSDERVSVLGFGPKLGFGSRPVFGAVYFPVGTALGWQNRNVLQSKWQFHPTVLTTMVFSDNFEVTPSGKILIPLGGKGEAPYYAINLNIALSSNLTKWAIRPEVGILIRPEDDVSYTQTSIGFSFSL